MNNYNQNISKEDIARINNSVMFKKSIHRMAYGFKSLKNPFNAIISLLYVAAVIKLWFLREELIKYICPKAGELISTMYHWLFTISIPLLGFIIFLAIIKSFSTGLFGARKTNNAFISAGIYTNTGKTPWLIGRKSSEKIPIMKVWTIFLNGNEPEQFTTKKRAIESEMGINIKNFVEDGKQIILMYSTPDKAYKKSNRKDKNF